MLILETVTARFKHGEYGYESYGSCLGRPKYTNVLRVKYEYNGYTVLGFEYNVIVDIWKNVACSADLSNNLWMSNDDVISVITDPMRIYLSQTEVEEMYKDPKEFYMNYIQGSKTCYVQTVIDGGAGSDN